MSNDLLLRRRYLLNQESNNYIKDSLVCLYDAEQTQLQYGSTATLYNLANAGTYDCTCEGQLEDNYENKGLKFMGDAAQYINVPAFSSLNNANELTYEIVLKPVNVTTTQRVLYLKGNYEFFLRNSVIQIAIYQDGTLWGSAANIEPNNLITCTGTFKANEFKKMYLNGVFKTETTASSGSQTTTAGYIGQGNGTYPLSNGSMFYAFRIYSKALSDDEILQNYNLDLQRFGG